MWNFKSLIFTCAKTGIGYFNFRTFFKRMCNRSAVICPITLTIMDPITVMEVFQKTCKLSSISGQKTNHWFCHFFWHRNATIFRFSNPYNHSYSNGTFFFSLHHFQQHSLGWSFAIWTKKWIYDYETILGSHGPLCMVERALIMTS